ncbi:MAG TPA: hypothetical protein VLA71_13280 [Algoriphagus sp.]|nr:hypothetical protein [Algoriphagus sp.]
MPIKYQILCSCKAIEKGETAITHIGGRNPLGEVWSLKIEEVIEGIQSGKWEFFMNLGRNSYPVMLSESSIGFDLKSAGTEKNLILELPDCPDQI